MSDVLPWWRRIFAVSSSATLKRRGILGINARNAQCVFPLNPRSLFPRVDDKLNTKAICESHGIPVPHTYHVVSRYGDLRELPLRLSQLERFVIKPAQGSGGRGVLVVVRRDDEGFHLADGSTLTAADIRYHTASTLSGLYSLGGQPDRAIVEQLVVTHPQFAGVTVEGTPDVRVIVYRAQVAMAMLRLPTHRSRGRANLHQGAVAAGIDDDTGLTRGGVYLDQAVDVHPDTNEPIAGLAVPGWREIRESAVTLAAAIGLGFVGIDFVIDAHQGPVVLEANARPGLAIQTANRRGLRHALDAIDASM